MRLLTMNVFARHGDWRARRRVLAAGMRDLDPDVATLQETVVTSGTDQVRELFPDHAHVLHQAGRSSDGVGASIVSRWPLEVLGQFDLDEPSGGMPTCWIGSLALVVVAAPPPIGPVILAHHKPAWESHAEAIREQQALRAVLAIEELVGDDERPLVLLGDLDAEPEAASVRFLTGLASLEGRSVRFQDAWAAVHGDAPGHTFTPRNPLMDEAWRPRPGRRIDHVLVGCGSKGAPLLIDDCQLAFEEPVDGVWASDHFGVVVDVSVRRS